MTGKGLAEWQRRCGYRGDAQAAAALGKSVSAYRRMRTGRVRVSLTVELLCCHLEASIDRAHILAEHWARIARLSPIAPAARSAVVNMLNRVRE